MYFATRKVTGEKVHLRKQLTPSGEVGEHERSARRKGSWGRALGSISASGPGKETRTGSQGGDNERVRALEVQRPRARQRAAELREHGSGACWRAPPGEQRKEGEQ